ncbi:MAG TPA: hypothetical protein VE753_01170 [Gaiellaceae bacterium]|jgi:hypothetical protein|nr:hypothetical protein [Gaiellaceae bacterium]
MPTVSQRTSTAQRRVRAPVRLRRPAAVTARPREQRLGDARAREAKARHDLALAVARAERTYTLAARSLEELDEYLGSVRARLRKAGYLGAAARRRR